MLSRDFIFKYRNFLIILSFMGLFILPIFLLYFNERHFILSEHLMLSWDNKEPKYVLKKDEKLCQSFEALEDNLSRIDVMTTKGKGPYKFEIYDDNKRTLIFKYLVDKTGQNYDFTKFIFPKIIESKNKIFHFCVQNSDENNTSLGLFNAKEKIYGHNIQFDNKNVNGNIVFQIYARNQDLSFVDFYRVLLARMSQYKPDMLKFWSFLGIFWAYFMAIIFFIISNFKGKK
ncbi:MAG: hypothetical protein UR27_C0002G0094 [Candidatus Peregrinibacteria bacterium GW2011_GWA2_33_10]|nr:MAG: hypothetical protein UR27_C0002G0094 [Candidatus Peregrinibacteria bacterium GW2011_GWA2_33_10]KKP41108.1 MAG: hypothetical protein UR30_C0002G0142 [Candidatus Peregrinibacteria bacterium GW2011_GWC2_33_13]